MVSVIRRWAGNKWVRRIGAALAVLLVYVAVRAYQQRDLVIGLAPELAGVAVDGRSFALSGEDRAALVYFWATWCPVCRLEHGTIESIAADWPVITVALQSGTDAELLRYLKDNGLKAATLNDHGGEQAANWGVRGMSTFFVVDRQRQIRFREVGFTSEWGLRVRLWLAERGT
jgi:thiol-disulfide isomerase/thioredoxin